MSKKVKQKNEYVSQGTKELISNTLVELGSCSDVVNRLGFDYAAWLLAYIVARKIQIKNTEIEEIKMSKIENTVSDATMDRLRSTVRHVGGGSVVDAPPDVLISALIDEKGELLHYIDGLYDAIQRLQEKFRE